MVKPEEEAVESTGPNQWEVAAHATPADDDWTYQARKGSNEGRGDVVFNQLNYVPTCNHMPTCNPKCEAPVFMWRKKAH